MKRWFSAPRDLPKPHQNHAAIAPELRGGRRERRRGIGQARYGVLLLSLAAVAGCVTHGTRPTAPVLVCSGADATSAQCAARIAAVETQAAAEAAFEASWRFQGRVALTSGKQSGNARVEWQHDLARDVVVLSAPVTRQSWRLEAGQGGAVLHGMANGPRQGGDAASLLRAASGWEIPVELMRDWVHGRPAPPDVARVSAWRFNEASAAPIAGLAGFDQAGWRIDILARDSEGRPTRLNAEAASAGHRVRLVIDQWSAAANE
ncbi:MAG: outer membrane lipoprotein LolB [Pseudomonadota bacterium]|nr:outer membrane lipoprotein LolB [Pseudomonadota bacterium]